jgi:hypothetical protein
LASIYSNFQEKSMPRLTAKPIWEQVTDIVTKSMKKTLIGIVAIGENYAVIEHAGF